MEFVITHATDQRWEAGQNPDPALLVRVRDLINDLIGAEILLGADGLRATSHGVRLRVANGETHVTRGPYSGANELTEGFVVIRTTTLEEAIAWGTRFARVKPELEMDVRPVTEPWDIGLGTRPPGHAGTRYMLVLKGDADSESGRRTPRQRALLEEIQQEMRDAGVLLASELLAPSAKGRRYKLSDGHRSVVDGPFTESKEMIAGYVKIRGASLQEAEGWAVRYQDAVDSHQVELRLVAGG
jgi:hypothetical protein